MNQESIFKKQMSNPFKDWSMRRVFEHNVKSSRKSETGSAASLNQTPDGDEYKLHEFIIAECKRRGWIVFHGSMAHQTFRTKGEPDFVILANCANAEFQTRPQRVFLIECKTKNGKLSPDQQAIKHWATTLGHTIHVVRSEQEFLEVLK